MATEGKERVLSTSVRRGCWHRAPQTGGLQTTGPFPAAVEPKKSKTKMLALSGGGLLCPDRGRWEGASAASLRAQIPFEMAPPS